MSRDPFIIALERSHSLQESLGMVLSGVEDRAGSTPSTPSQVLVASCRGLACAPACSIPTRTYKHRGCNCNHYSPLQHCPCARLCSSVAHARDAKTSDQAHKVGTHPLLAQMQLKPIPTALAHALAKDLLRSRHTRAHAHVTPTHRVLTIKGRVPHRQPCACASLRVSARTRARARVKRGMRARPHGPVGNPKPPSSQCRVGRFVGGVRSKTVKRQM